jgi:uncharacterized surface protein with fasciclin (FAS1) repeats
MKKWLIGLSLSCLVSVLTFAQDDATNDTTTETDPTVNVEALELFSGSILSYLESRSAQNPTGGLCYEQTAENVAPEAVSTDTDTTDQNTEGGADDTTTDDGSTDDTTNDDSTDDSSDDSSTDGDSSNTASAVENTDVADTNATYTCLIQILTSTGLAETLGGEGAFTLFAPTDDAFRVLAESMPASEFEALLANTEQLTQILNYHLLPEERSLNSLYTSAGTGSSPVTVTTARGSNLNLIFEDEPQSDEVSADGSSTSDSNEVSTQTFVRIGANATSTANQEGDAYAVQETVDTDNGFVIGIDHVLMLDIDSVTQ